MLAFPVGTSGETLFFPEDVLETLSAQRQLRWFQAESGGMVFATISGKDIILVQPSLPSRSDWRSRFSFRISQKQSQFEIDARHARGEHYIGEWHSHPERIPSPSSRDRKTMASRVRESRHALAGFVFVIIGQSDLPEGLTVMVHDGDGCHYLSPG